MRERRERERERIIPEWMWGEPLPQVLLICFFRRHNDPLSIQPQGIYCSKQISSRTRVDTDRERERGEREREREGERERERERERGREKERQREIMMRE